MPLDDDVSEIEKTRKLLAEVFPGAQKFQTSGFLDWQYLKSPSGRVIQTNLDHAVLRIGHYALVPQRWISKGADVKIALSLNTAISENHRLKGQFVDLAEKTFAAAKASGIEAIIGVANENSTNGFVNRLGFTLLGPLETRVIFRTKHDRPSALKRISKQDLLNIISTTREIGTRDSTHRIWDADELDWRLSSPGVVFDFFKLDEFILITTTSKYKGVGISVILKIFNLVGEHRMDMKLAASAICRQQGTFLALYSGLNPAVQTSGIFLPSSLRPSPLNLIFKPLTDYAASQRLSPTTFEFLDFDAY